MQWNGFPVQFQRVCIKAGGTWGAGGTGGSQIWPLWPPPLDQPLYLRYLQLLHIPNFKSSLWCNAVREYSPDPFNFFCQSVDRGIPCYVYPFDPSLSYKSGKTLLDSHPSELRLKLCPRDKSNSIWSLYTNRMCQLLSNECSGFRPQAISLHVCNWMDRFPAVHAMISFPVWLTPKVHITTISEAVVTLWWIIIPCGQHALIHPPVFILSACSELCWVSPHTN